MECEGKGKLTLVVVTHKALLEREELNNLFRVRDGFVLIRSTDGDPRTYMSSGGLRAVVVAEPSIFSTAGAPRPWPRDCNGGLLIMGPPTESKRIQDYIVAGAMGFIAEGAPMSQLRKAVRALARGEYWVDRATLSALVRGLLMAQPTSKLSPREIEILRLLPAGYSNRTIANRLGITYETVRWHLRSIYTKLGAKDRLSVIVQAQSMLTAIPELPLNESHLPESRC